jgi:hypothetical protein
LLPNALNLLTMSHPLKRPGKLLFSGIAAILLSFCTFAAPGVEKYPPSFCPEPHISPVFTFYKRDTSQGGANLAIVRHEKNGDVVIAVPSRFLGRYRIRFFGEDKGLLFEIRQIQDPLLIVEKYNFGHAGLFRYELYRDNSLVESRPFRINP